MTLSEELTWRGFVNQTTFTDITEIDEPRTLYYGVDPSASSMHIGQLSNALMIRHFMDHGHKIILLVGGATGMIGDPGGKTDERQLKSLEEITANKHAIAQQYETLFDGQTFDVVDNLDWFKDIGYLDFLRDVGKHFSMTQLLDRDFIKTRIGDGNSGISYAEFSYGLIQGYDFLHLYREKGATLQIAGSDQWGNSISGVDMIRKLEGETAHVWTAPLILDKTTGKKFGKSEGNAIWLDPAQTSPFKFYQFWLNVDDTSVIDYLKIYTLLPMKEIEQHAVSLQNDPRVRGAQKALAYEVTRLVHGEERANAARSASNKLFGSEHAEILSDASLEMLSQELPVVERESTITDGEESPASITVSEALERSGVASSKGDARRLIAGGAISIDGVKVLQDEILQRQCVIKKGKNSFILVR